MSLLAPYVLVVDDDPAIGRLARRILKRAGFAVAVLGTGASAIAHIRTWVPDLVLVDLGLPDMSGEQVMATIRKELRSTAPPMIAFTGESVSCVEHAVAVCTKPFPMGALVEVVRTHVRSRS